MLRRVLSPTSKKATRYACSATSRKTARTLTAEAVVSGSFRTIAGTVISVDPAAGEIKLNDLDTKKPVTIKVNADSQIRKLPPMAAMMLARRLNPTFAAAMPAWMNGGRRSRADPGHPAKTPGPPDPGPTMARKRRRARR